MPDPSLVPPDGQTLRERHPARGPIRPRTEEQLRVVVSMLANFVWTKQLRPGEHMWSIPVDQERDFDCILTDAIDELVQLRSALHEAEQRALTSERFRLEDAASAIDEQNRLRASLSEARQERHEWREKYLNELVLPSQLKRAEAAEAQLSALRDGIRLVADDMWSCSDPDLTSGEQSRRAREWSVQLSTLLSPVPEDRETTK